MQIPALPHELCEQIALLLPISDRLRDAATCAHKWFLRPVLLDSNPQFAFRHFKNEFAKSEFSDCVWCFLSRGKFQLTGTHFTALPMSYKAVVYWHVVSADICYNCRGPRHINLCDLRLWPVSPQGACSIVSRLVEPIYRVSVSQDEERVDLVSRFLKWTCTRGYSAAFEVVWGVFGGVDAEQLTLCIVHALDGTANDPRFDNFFGSRMDNRQGCGEIVKTLISHPLFQHVASQTLEDLARKAALRNQSEGLKAFLGHPRFDAYLRTGKIIQSPFMKHSATESMRLILEDGRAIANPDSNFEVLKNFNFSKFSWPLEGPAQMLACPPSGLPLLPHHVIDLCLVYISNNDVEMVKVICRKHPPTVALIESGQFDVTTCLQAAMTSFKDEQGCILEYFLKYVNVREPRLLQSCLIYATHKMNRNMNLLEILLEHPCLDILESAPVALKRAQCTGNWEVEAMLMEDSRFVDAAERVRKMAEEQEDVNILEGLTLFRI